MCIRDSNRLNSKPLQRNNALKRKRLTHKLKRPKPKHLRPNSNSYNKPINRVKLAYILSGTSIARISNPRSN